MLLKVILFFLSVMSFSLNADSYKNNSCLNNPKKLNKRSIEMQKLVSEDQKDREDMDSLSAEELIQLDKRDLKRRKRVGQIFAEGCFHQASDYSAAALIYQHGDTPDHYYQAFIWANRAVEEGDQKEKQLASLAIDRYLVSKGKKQLFASQVFSSEATRGCFCMQQVEESFPDSYRKEYSGFEIQKRIDWLISLNEGKNCPDIECSMTLAPTPKGSLPGFW